MAAAEMVEPVEGPEDHAFRELLAKIARESGFRCSSYKERCLRRRIAVRLRARGVHAFADYATLLDGDAGEWERLLDALTINVTRLFRDPSTFDALARVVVPALWRLDAPALRVWSAGCASGEEAYSLAALFHRHAEQLGQPARAGRVCVLGSDIDRGSLDAAARGCYAEPAFADTPAALRERYFARPAGCAAPELRAMVRWERRDLLHDSPPPGALHLIVCRNVLIYFDRRSQEELLARFRAALAPGGFLVLGKVETLLGEARAGFEAAQPRERIFRRT
ncbi:MAG TPA: protein-glutamate O-methyltransferase CheR [Gemmatimonadaceae bacterium]|jgi:chemotaxis methyl-accepting protein methylase